MICEIREPELELALVRRVRWPSDMRRIAVGVHGQADQALLDGIEALIRGHEGWNSACGLQFDFWYPEAAADVRISFEEGGSWSYMGTDCHLIARNRPTMNFGWLKPGMSEVEFRRVVLHEFGHALGFAHEHQSPLLEIPWNMAKVYEHYLATNGWTEAEIRANVIGRFTPEEVVQEEGDPFSIMCYLINPELLTHTTDRIGGQTKLSAFDRQRAEDWYGPPPEVWRPTPLPLIQG